MQDFDEEVNEKPSPVKSIHKYHLSEAFKKE
jgi:hypothetical protein